MTALIQKVLQDIPHHVAMAIFEHFQERRKARKAEEAHRVEGVSSTLNSFVLSIVQHDFSKALQLCTPGMLLALHQGPTLEANLVHLRTLILSFESTRGASFHFDSAKSTCHITLEFVYTGGAAAPATFDFLAAAGDWKISGYSVAAHSGQPPAPQPAIPTPSLTLAPKPPSIGATPQSNGACPAGYPIKGGRSGIYHKPGGRYYDKARPVLCFATEAQAKAAGYRASTS